MDDYLLVFQEMRDAGIEVDLEGEQSDEAIQELEALLAYSLPTSYRLFVKNFGFAGPEYNPYKGITQNDCTKEVSESAYYMSRVLQKDWGLPNHLLVVWHEYDLMLAMCIDLTTLNKNAKLYWPSAWDLMASIYRSKVRISEVFLFTT